MTNKHAEAYRYKDDVTALPIELNLSADAAKLVRKSVYRFYLNTDRETEERILSKVLDALDQVTD